MKNEVKRLPGLFLERLQRIVPARKYDTVANTFLKSKPTSFRTNTLKISAAVLQEKLEHQGFRLERFPKISGAFILRRGKLRELQETQSYREGEIYVQGLSSMIPPLVLDPKPEELVLDLTAAPGSKTTQMAALMEGKGRIVANDNNRVRFFKLKANVELQGAVNIELSLRHGEVFSREFPERFDRVLLDAPCSAEGRFRVEEPSSYRYWKRAKIKEMVRKQKRLMFSAIRALRRGGILVYSTCTFAPEENEGVLDWALRKFQNEISIEKVELPLAGIGFGMGRWGDREFHPSVRSALRIFPTSEIDGFFIAKLSKA